ncbi:LITAF-like zinc ribbon domain [Popillia japonica]|uniref:LITAF-like zinc ribbon domain n=1 Tax=Popillia japonica TaxID=7064 RepID=A0AAW1L754_POPJA
MPMPTPATGPGFKTTIYPSAPGHITVHGQTSFPNPPFPTGEGSAPSGYIPPHAQTVTQVVIQAPVNFGHKSQPVMCSVCKHEVLTRIDVEPSTQTHLCALLMCAFGIWPCCCIPYCVDSCQKINHYCPNCGVYLGSYQN